MSYFAEVLLNLVLRTYIGPFVEKIEVWSQKAAILLSQRFKFVEKMFRDILKRQLRYIIKLTKLILV